MVAPNFTSISRNFRPIWHHRMTVVCLLIAFFFFANKELRLPSTIYRRGDGRHNGLNRRQYYRNALALNAWPSIFSLLHLHAVHALDASRRGSFFAPILEIKPVHHMRYHSCLPSLLLPVGYQMAWIRFSVESYLS